MEAVVMERRNSTDSNDSSNCSKQGDDGTGTGRILKPTSPKPPPNALQFIKTGPCDLYKKAQEQIKKAEEIKKEKKTMRNDTEEWQSNLDNWKSSRRKMQEHIIERVVEVKKFELEDHERNRRRSKTFSEMMQERGRKASIPVYDDSSANDFSDLGLSSNNQSISNGSSSIDDSNSEDNDNHVFKENKVSLTNGEVSESKTNGDVSVETEEVFESIEVKKESTSSSEKEEYTYERAIQNYVNFAETRVKSLSARSIPDEVKSNDKSPSVKEPPPVPAKPRRCSAPKTDVFSKAELYRKSVSTTDLTDTSKKVAVPKIDISRRRELFEKIEPENKSTVVSRSTVDLNSSKSIKERLSFLEKNNDGNKSKSLERPSPEISVKARLTSIENLKRQDNQSGKSKPGEIISTSIKDRLSNLEKSKCNNSKQTSNIDTPTSIKERLSSLQSACNKEITKTVAAPKTNPDFHEKLTSFQEIEASTEEVYPLSEDTGYGYSSEDLFEAKKSRHYRHRSLDSLDVDDSPASNETFERVQSYEDLEYCRNYPASSLSGDTDREDSGIHTADVSSSVSQADDFDLHLDSNLSDDIKIAHQQPSPAMIEDLKIIDSKNPVDFSENVSCLRFEVPENCLTPRAYTKLDCSSPLPAILENPAEFNSSVDIPVVNTYSPYSSPLHSSHEDEKFSSSHPTHLSYSSNLGETDVTYLEPRTSIPSDCENTVIEVCEQIYIQEAKPSQTYATLHAQSSSDTKNFNGFEGKDISNSSDVTLVEIEEINDTELIDKDLLLDDEPVHVSEPESPVVEEIKDLPDQSDIVSTTNQIIALHSRDQSSEDLTPPIIPTKIKESVVHTEPKVDHLVIDLDMTVVNVTDTGSVFPLSPTALEPPKEKPPPPPTENSDDDLDDNKTGPMQRLGSAKRIKKEIRLKRSSFLGLDGSEDYTDPEIELTRPPDLTALLTEERRLERQLYRQSLCSETDSNQESRDSGVELDNKTPDPWVSHSRNNSDNFGNQSTTSEEDDIMKKEREIIETLEQEERIRKQHLGEKLAMRLRELESVEKDTLEWQRMYDSVEVSHVEKTENQTEINDVDDKGKFTRDCEKSTNNGEGMWYDHSSDTESVREPGYLYSPSSPLPHSHPVPSHRSQTLPPQPVPVDRQYDRSTYNMVERQPYQQPAERQFQMAERQAFQPPERQTFQERPGYQANDRNNYIAPVRQTFQSNERQYQQPVASERHIVYQQQQSNDRGQFEQSVPVHYKQNGHTQHQMYTGSLPHEKSHNHQHHPGSYTLPYRSSYGDLTQSSSDIKEIHRRSMPELQAITRRSMPDLQQANATNSASNKSNSRPMPDMRRPPPPALPAKPNHINNCPQQAPQPMTRTTKQALSAAPRSRLISNESWQAKRKPKQENCNYQHWLIQEAEHRRITEQQKRQSNVIRSQTSQVQVMQTHHQQPIQQHAIPLSHHHNQMISSNQWIPNHKPVYTSTPAPPQWTSHSKREKPLPDSIIQTLTQRVQNRKPDTNNNRRRYENVPFIQNEVNQEKVLSVSGKKRCSACGDELGRGAAMIIESLQLFYHIDCFKCCVCCMQLGDGLMGTDVRVRNNKLHCHNCYSSDDGAKFSCV